MLMTSPELTVEQTLHLNFLRGIQLIKNFKKRLPKGPPEALKH